LGALGRTELRHGDGVAAEDHEEACRLGARVVVHPPTDDRNRALCDGDERRELLPHLERNRKIVGATEVLVNCPGEAKERLRSGTWATIRYARKAGRPVRLVLLDGAVQVERV
jgi:hypothetical protein